MRGKDFIYVKNLLVKATTGVDAWQRAVVQPLNIGLRINVGNRLRRMNLTDDIRRTLNYDSLSTLIVDTAESKQYKSIDEAAESTAKLIQDSLSKGEWADVTISQPKARLLAKSRQIKLKTNDSANIVESLKQVCVPTIIGINDLERIYKQEVEVNLDVRRQAGTEVFTHEFTSEIAEYIQSSQFLTIESFVNAVAKYICESQRAQHINEVTVRAAKPSALNMAAGAGVQVTRKPSDFTESCIPSQKDLRNLVYIAFGTNQGDRIGNIEQSITELRHRGIEVMKSSAIYQSEPMYFTEQPQFLNGVFECRTDLDPDSLLAALKDIEYNRFERVKKFDNGPRPLDLDIILFNDEYIESEKLTVPHKDMLNRSFVLQPLNDLLPSDPASKYEESTSANENTIVPLYSNTPSPSVPQYLEFNPQHPHHLGTTIMAIMNATPDSFSDGGDLLSMQPSHIGDVASAHIKNGAAILDVGGYSTRPGAAEVSPEEESRRVCSAIRKIRETHTDAVISVDTFRGSVALDALQSGANIINDVFSGVLDPSILEVAANTGAPIILSHARGTPETMKQLTSYPEGVLTGVATELRARVDAALAAGCKTWQLILDPGLGFAKTPEQDLEIVRRFSELKHSKILTDGLPVLPWLVGPSRKSFIGHYVNETTPKRRVAGTLAVVTALRQQGADIIRVHDTKEANQALLVADEIYRA